MKFSELRGGIPGPHEIPGELSRQWQTVHLRCSRDQPPTDQSPALDLEWQKKKKKCPALKKKKESV